MRFEQIYTRKYPKTSRNGRCGEFNPKSPLFISDSIWPCFLSRSGGPKQEISCFSNFSPWIPNFSLFSQVSSSRKNLDFCSRSGYKSSLDPKEIKNKEKGSRNLILKSKSTILKFFKGVSGVKRAQISWIFEKKTLCTVTSTAKSSAPWRPVMIFTTKSHILASRPGNLSNMTAKMCFCCCCSCSYIANTKISRSGHH